MHGDATSDGQRSADTASPANDQIAYKVPQAAKVLDLSARKVWELVYAGEIESIKIGRSRRVTRAALVAYVDRLRGAA